jgi:polar amino acid transport system substrate-binding protein
MTLFEPLFRIGLLAAVIAALGFSAVVSQSRAVSLAEAQEAQQAPTIPNFWDPRARSERPAAGTVPSLRFLTTDDFPPFNFLDDGGRLTGFNVDLARAICSELTIECTIQAREWDDLVGHLLDKTADAVIAGIAINEANREVMDFSDVYLRPAARFIVRREDAGLDVSAEGLRGKTLAVVTRTAHEAFLAAMFPEVARKLYPTADAARAAVKAGEADAHFGDGMELSFWLQSFAAGNCCVFAGGPYLESRFFGQGYAIAIAKDSPVIKQAINTAMESVYEKGVYGELYLRYFPLGYF